MQKVLNIQNNQFQYTLKSSTKARKMRLAIYCDGEFVVTAPKNLCEELVEKFLLKHSDWIIKRLNAIKLRPKLNYGNYADHKSTALMLAQQRVEYFNSFYNFKFNRISIRNQKTRWGSCSRKSNLNFNYKIALIMRDLADYVIVHELCHLQEFNHGPKFWTLMAQTIPDYLRRRKELKKL